MSTDPSDNQKLDFLFQLNFLLSHYGSYLSYHHQKLYNCLSQTVSKSVLNPVPMDFLKSPCLQVENFYREIPFTEGRDELCKRGIITDPIKDFDMNRWSNYLLTANAISELSAKSFLRSIMRTMLKQRMEFSTQIIEHICAKYKTNTIHTFFRYVIPSSYTLQPPDGDASISAEEADYPKYEHNPLLDDNINTLDVDTLSIRPLR